jgi:molybdopterin-containing oxidoreductase family membrane subunit
VKDRHDRAEQAVLLRPLLVSGQGFWLSFAILGAGTAWLLFNFWRQFEEGHGVTGQGSHGTIWGIVVANIINFIGISHVGIAISAVVRIMRLERYQQLARLAELVTLAAITTAVFNIMLDVGRPERFILNVMWYGRPTSPLLWSCTVITTYVVGSSVYLYLAMRHDLATCARSVTGRRRLYWLLALGYHDDSASRARHARVVWWMAVIIIPIMVSVHSVYGYIFGLQAGRPGWFNPFQAPYFVLGAIVSGFSAMIVVLAVIRKAFGWDEIFHPRIFKGLGIFLGFVTLLYMYFLFSEYLTGLYASPHAERIVFHDLIFGRFALLLWTALLGGMVLPFALLFIQGVNRGICSVGLTVGAALLINLSLWTTRGLIVVPSFYHPHLSWPKVPYVPTFAEWSMVIGSVFLFGFLLLVMVKLLPVLELSEEVAMEEQARPHPMPVWKKVAVGSSLTAGVGLIAFGVSHRDFAEIYHSPVFWLAGIVVLWSVPFQICVLPEPRRPRPAEGDLAAQPWRRRAFGAWLVLLAAAGAALAARPASASHASVSALLPGNPLEGSRLFTGKGCLRCHAVHDVGGSTGPDLGRRLLNRPLLEIAGIMWNHSPGMEHMFQEKGVPRPTFEPGEMASLLSFLYYLGALDPPGNAAVGARLFAEKRCEQCHRVGGKGGTVGPGLDGYSRHASPLFLTTALWNRGRPMALAMERQGIARQSFQGSDIADLFAYIREAGGATERIYLPPGKPKAGEVLFVEKRCVECHAIRGHGGKEGPDLGITLKGSFVRIAGSMWNHGPGMWARMRALRIEVPVLGTQEMSDLVSYLYFFQFIDAPGDPRRGLAVYTEKRCGGCHSIRGVGKAVAADLATVEKLDTSLEVVTGMWNHGATMEAVMVGANVAWPFLKGGDMADLIAYLLQARGGAPPAASKPRRALMRGP